MADLNNTNAEDGRPTPSSDDGGVPETPHDGAGNGADGKSSDPSGDITDLDAAWSSFERSHAEDLDEVARSRSAKRFEKRAVRKDKEALLSISDLDEGTFTNDMPRRGPRDFTQSSWLNVDSTIHGYGDDFVPPNPKLGHISASKLLFWALLVGGVIGIILTVFLPSIAGILGTVFGVAILIGAAGLMLRHRGHNESKTDFFDDGARV